MCIYVFIEYLFMYMVYVRGGEWGGVFNGDYGYGECLYLFFDILSYMKLIV